MPTITSAGIGSGLDVESLITKLVAVERTPINLLQVQTDKLKTQLSTFGKVQSAIATMRDAASKLTNVDTWGANAASSSDSASVAVSAGSGAVAGNVTVAVSKLAASQTLASQVLPAAPGVVGTGQITIELGSWGAGQTTFTPKSGVTAVTIDIASGSDQLSQIRDKINAAKAGVVASIVTDSSGQRLVMRSSSTGESNAFRVSVNDADGNSTDASGLSALAFDPSASVGSMSQTLAAANAQATINGLAINSESNVLTGTMDGLNITLLKTTSSDVTLTVAPDKDLLKKAVTDFSSAYNSLTLLLREQTKYDSGSKTAGALQGDSTAVGLQAQLRALTGSSTTLGGAFTRLADIGLNPGTDGQLVVNTSKLDTALGNLTDLKQFFMGLDAADAGNNGLAQKLKSFGDKVLSTDGSLSTKQTGLQTRINNNSKRSSELEDRVALAEKRLRAQYTALDTKMGQLTSLSSYVSQQMALLSKTS